MLRKLGIRFPFQPVFGATPGEAPLGHQSADLRGVSAFHSGCFFSAAKPSAKFPNALPDLVTLRLQFFRFDRLIKLFTL